MKNRIELVKHFAELGFRKGAEIGVYEGYFSQVLLDNIPNLNLLSVDPWHRATIHAGLYAGAVKLLSAYPNSTILRGFSVDIAALIPDGSLDFVYIDGDHSYECVKDDISNWAAKVKKGGIVAGDDYYKFKSGNDGVVMAVDEYVKKYGYKLESTEWNRRGSHKDNWHPSWYFNKEDT